MVVANVGEYGVPIVVDDGSTDHTGEIAAVGGAKVVRHGRNRGYDAAISSGFAYASEAGFEFAITVDADGQHNPSQIGTFLDCLDQGCDLVLGVRDRMQRFGEQLFSVVARRLWNISDPLCGMKAYRMSAYRRVGAFDTFGSIGTELAVRIVASGGKYHEVAVITRDRIDSPRFGNRLKGNARILRSLWILGYRHAAHRLEA